MLDIFTKTSSQIISEFTTIESLIKNSIEQKAKADENSLTDLSLKKEIQKQLKGLNL